MRVIMCGDRNWDDLERVGAVISTLKTLHEPMAILVQAGSGICAMVKRFTSDLNIPVEEFDADWKHDPCVGGVNLAGVKRNERMMIGGKPDLVVAFHDNLARSKSTRNMVSTAEYNHVYIWLISRDTAENADILQKALQKALRQV